MTKDEEKEHLAALEFIKNQVSSLSAKTITMGFDGFIDSVVRVIKHKDHHRPTYFESIQELGDYLIEKRHRNFSLEIEEITTKLGGNMPITANALAQLGPKVSCIGPLGYPAIHPVFQQMSPGCDLLSFANPGVSKVMEFKKGKMMLAEMAALNKIEWKFIRETIGADTFHNLFSKSDLIALLNWSELDNSTEIWNGLLHDILPDAKPEKRPIGLFDLADCSKRNEQCIQEAMELITAFSAYWDVVLSLNLNEANVVHAALSRKKRNDEDIEKMCEEIYDKLDINTVVIHHSQQSVARNKEGLHKRNSFFIKEPMISCGSGDNFNAGFCMGRLLNLDIGTSLVLGHATSSLYMQSAKSPTTAAVLEFVSNNLQNSEVPASPVASAGRII